MEDNLDEIRESDNNLEIVKSMMIDCGLDLSKRILEISDYAESRSSISHKLSRDYTELPFLLSKNFNEKEARKYGIDGAKGQLYSPFGDVSIKRDDGVQNPTIDDFDTIIVPGYSNDLLLLTGLRQDIYAGYSFSPNYEYIDELRSVYRIFYETLNLKQKEGYIMTEQQLVFPSKEIVLIHKRNY